MTDPQRRALLLLASRSTPLLSSPGGMYGCSQYAPIGPTLHISLAKHGWVVATRNARQGWLIEITQAGREAIGAEQAVSP